MSITTSEKIFVDPNDEITFIVERLLGSDKNKVILVIPQNSVLLSSFVSINILLRKVVKSNKIAVIVTEDEYGLNMSERIGFVVVTKVSQINSELWEVSKQKKIKLLDKLNERKKELLSNITGEEDFYKANDSEVKKEEEDIKNESNEYINEEPTVIENFDQNIKPPEEYRSLSTYKKRQEPKIINVDGIEILGGGDIKFYIDELGNDKISEEDVDLNKFNNGDSNAMGNLRNRNTIGERKFKSSNSSNFTNKDFTKAVKEENRFSKFFSNLFKPKRIQDPNERFEGISQQNRTRRLKVLLALIIILIALTLLIGYIIAFKLSKVDVVLRLKKEDVSTSATVVVNPTTNQITTNPLTIPGKIIAQDKTSLSKTGSADGIGKKGNKAQGNITMYNFQTKITTLKAGTKVTNSSNNLAYLLINDINLDPAKFGSDGVKNPNKKDDIAISASDVGTNYNVIDVPNPIKFTIDGYNSDQVSATEFNSITGGTLENFTSVSKDNIAKLHDTIVPDLKSQILDKIRASTPPGYKLIEGSINYAETANKSFPDQDQESKDKTFNLTLEMTATALAVKNDDLVSSVTILLQNSKSQNSSDSFVVENVNDPLINKVDKVNNNYVLTISSKGSLTARITVDQMKKDIEGLSIQQTKDYFSLLNYIDQFTVSYIPELVPNSIKRVPLDATRISIVTK